MSTDDALNAALAQLSKNAKNSRALAEKKLKHWHKWRVEKLGLPDGPQPGHTHDATCMLSLKHWDGHECTFLCSLDGRRHNPAHTCDNRRGCVDNMMLINEPLRLYGCVRSGAHHFCPSSRSHRCILPSCPERERYHGCKHSRCVFEDPLRNAHCIDTHMNRDSEHVCIFSNVSIEGYITRSHYERPVTSRNRFYTEGGEEDAPSADGDTEASGEVDLPENSAAPLELLWTPSSSTATTTTRLPKPHTSTPHLLLQSPPPTPSHPSHPRGGGSKVKRKRPASSGSSSSKRRNRGGRGWYNGIPLDCDRSGSSGSSVTSTNTQELGSKEDTNRRVQRRLEALRSLEDKAHRIVWDLLFDDRNRDRVNRDRTNGSLSQFVSRTAMYLNQQHEGPGKLHVMMEIYHGERVPVVPTSPRSTNERMASYYANICVRMWKRLGTKRLTCAYHQYVLSLLYCLRHGMRKQGKVVAEPDEFLAKYLPHENDLRQFECTLGKSGRKASKRIHPAASSRGNTEVVNCYRKKDITSGDTCLRSAILHSSYELLKRSYDGEDWDPIRFARESADRSIQRKLERLRASPNPSPSSS